MARRRFSGYGDYRMRSCVPIIRKIYPEKWNKSAAALRKILARFGKVEQYSKGCFYVEGLTKGQAEALKAELKAQKFYPCSASYKARS